MHQIGIWSIEMNEAGTNFWITSPSELHTLVLLGHSAPKCIIQKSVRKTWEDTWTWNPKNVAIQAFVKKQLFRVRFGFFMPQKQIPLNELELQNGFYLNLCSDSLFNGPRGNEPFVLNPYMGGSQNEVPFFFP